MDSENDVDYVPTVFVYAKQVGEVKKARNAERASRADKRRRLTETMQADKENQETAAEGLVLLQEAQFTHQVGTQTASVGKHDASIQAALPVHEHLQ